MVVEEAAEVEAEAEGGLIWGQLIDFTAGQSGRRRRGRLAKGRQITRRGSVKIATMTEVKECSGSRTIAPITDWLSRCIIQRSIAVFLRLFARQTHHTTDLDISYHQQPPRRINTPGAGPSLRDRNRTGDGRVSHVPPTTCT